MRAFKFTIPYTVRVADVNYGGHVANSAVLDICQEGRIAYLENLDGRSELEIGNGCGIILTEARVKYLAEMFRGDELTVGVRISEVGRSSFSMTYRIERDGIATAEGTTTLVCFDYQARKPRRLPEDFVAAATAFEGLQV